MKALTRFAGLRIWDDRAAARAVQGGAYVAGVAILVLAIRALTRVARTEAELLIGLFAALALAVSMICLGTVTAIHEEVRRR